MHTSDLLLEIARKIVEDDRKLEFARCVLDKPEDRLWHAADGTWWSNPNGPQNPTLCSADMPEALNRKLAAYDGLLAACEAARANLVVWQDSPAWSEDDKDTLAQLEAAIAQARKEAP